MKSIGGPVTPSTMDRFIESVEGIAATQEYVVSRIKEIASKGGAFSCQSPDVGDMSVEVNHASSETIFAVINLGSESASLCIPYSAMISESGLDQYRDFMSSENFM